MGLHNIDAYNIISQKKIDDINSEGYIFEHKKTGARVVCIHNDDINKVFYIGFRTPPVDSTGVPHIIEHSVLCGSRKYPAKDPFVELAKGSLNTFLNAMTYPDKTVYPIASCNDQDFKNLTDVYLDAVFYPNIYSRPQIFKQEGWHYELDSADADVTLNGVVYSEMKGAFSSPDDVFDRTVFDSLFPDTCYGVESGGDPDVIPTLTYEEFLDFHKKYYHPSNSYIYLYGDFDIEERLNYIDKEYLSKFDRLEIDSSIGIQKEFDSVRTVVKEYSVTSDEPLEDNTYMSVNSVISTSLDRKLYIAFQIIEYALLSAPGAVLKQALLDKGICKDVQSVYENGIYQPYFSIIVKNSNESSKQEFLNVISDVLADIVNNGFDKKSLYAAINASEFKFREADFGHYPKGLMYGLQVLDSWLYDDESPFIHIEALDTFEFLKKQVETDYFEQLVKKYLVENKHQSVVVMTPARGLNTQKDKELAEKLADYKKGLCEADILKLIDDTEALHKYQEEEDDEETLATIPLLKISDIKAEAEDFIYEEHVKDDVTYLTHDIFTNGIGYLIAGFDITNMDEELLPYVGILKSVLGIIDTENYTYADLANEINLNSGGVTAGSGVNSMIDCPDEYINMFELRAKVLYSKLDFAFDMFEEIAFKSKLDDKKRLYEIICMLKSRLSSSMVSSGHVVSSHRALSHVSKADAVIERVSGLEFYRVIEKIESDFDNQADDLVKALYKVASMIFNRNNLKVIDYTATSDQYEKLYELGRSFADKLPTDVVKMKDFDFTRKAVREGYKTGAKVQYVSKAGRYRDDTHPYTGALKVLKVIMGYDYLWNQVRVVGGAYGAFASFTKSGEGSFASYRDPNLARTLEIYDKAVNYLENFDVNERDMTKYIIGTIADIDIPRTPSAKGLRGLDAYLSGNKLEYIQKERDEILGATTESIRALSEYVKNMQKDESICVIGGEEVIETESKLFDYIEPLFKK